MTSLRPFVGIQEAKIKNLCVKGYTPSTNIGLELELEFDVGSEDITDDVDFDEDAPNHNLNADQMIGTSFYTDRPEGFNTWWNIGLEHSLRSGLELITKPQVLYKEPSWYETLKSLQRYLATYDDKILTSIRTSTHIHVSVQDLTVYEVYNAILNWYIIEEVVVSTCPKERRGNLFCLRARDASGIFGGIKKRLKTFADTARVLPETDYALDSTDYSYMSNVRHEYKKAYNSLVFNQDDYKYAALNLANILYLGTLEFRFMPAFCDTDISKLERYAEICYSAVNKGAKVPVAKTLYVAQNGTTRDVLELFFNKGVVDFLLTYSEDCSIQRRIEEVEMCQTYLNKALNQTGVRRNINYWKLRPADLKEVVLQCDTSSVDVIYPDQERDL